MHGLRFLGEHEAREGAGRRRPERLERVPARLAVGDERPGEGLDRLVLDRVALREARLRAAEL